jgi:hypothetical protein
MDMKTRLAPYALAVTLVAIDSAQASKRRLYYNENRSE